VKKVIENLAIEVATSMEAYCPPEQFGQPSTEYLALHRAKQLLGELPPQAEAVLKKIEKAAIAILEEEKEVRCPSCGCLVS
jgi:hypothetical protein